MKNLYYVCSKNREFGISRFDNSNDSMTSVSRSKNKLEWKIFTYDDAVEAQRHCGYEVVEVF